MTGNKVHKDNKNTAEKCKALLLQTSFENFVKSISQRVKNNDKSFEEVSSFIITKWNLYTILSVKNCFKITRNIRWGYVTFY